MKIYDSTGKNVVGHVEGDSFYRKGDFQSVGRMSDEQFFNNTGELVGFMLDNYVYDKNRQQAGYVKHGVIYDITGKIIGHIDKSCPFRLAGGAILFLLLAQ